MAHDPSRSSCKLYLSCKVVDDNLKQKATASIERDENYVPYTRRDYQLPEKQKARNSDYADAFKETPFFTLARVFVMQTW
jgi:hypothetical protein